MKTMTDVTLFPTSTHFTPQCNLLIPKLSRNFEKKIKNLIRRHFLQSGEILLNDIGRGFMHFQA